MNINELTLLTIYAVAAADGKAGGGVTKTIPKLTGLSLDEIEQKSLILIKL